MRIALLHLPPDADVPWLRDRITWAQAPWVLLVLPREGVPRLEGVVPWVLVARHARRQGKMLAVVTRSRHLVRVLEDAGIPVFGTVAAAHQRPWRIRHGKRRLFRRFRRVRRGVRSSFRGVLPSWRARRIESPAARWAAVLLGLIALALLAAFFLPSARVQVPVRVQTRRHEVEVILSPDLQGPHPGLPGLPLVPGEVTVETWRVIRATGSTVIPTQAAETRLLWTNLTHEAVHLPKGLVVQDVEGQMDFYLVEEGRLPPQSGATVWLRARAVQPGPRGNVPAHRLRMLFPPWEFRVVVTNPEAAQGGEERSLPTLSKKDLPLRRVLKRMEGQARRLAQVTAPPGMLPLPVAVDLLDLSEARLLPEPGWPVQSGLLYVQARYRVWWVPRSALDALARSLLPAWVTPGREVWPGSLEVELLPPKPGQGPPFQALVRMTWQEREGLDPWRLAWEAAGRPRTWVTRAWAAAPWSAGSPRVETRPLGLPWLPAGFRVEVVLEAVAPAP